MNHKNRLKKISCFILAVAVLIIILAPAGCSVNKISSVDSIAPEFQLKDLNGQTISLKDNRGKIVLINFWASTCGPCVDEMPHFQALYNEWSTRSDVALFTINIGESSSTVQNFMQSNNYNFPVLLDSQGKAANSYGVRYTPTSCFIDGNGILKVSIVGAFKDKAAIEKKAVEVGFKIE